MTQEYNISLKMSSLEELILWLCLRKKKDIIIYRDRDKEKKMENNNFMSI